MMLYKLISHMNPSYFQNIVVSLTNKGTLGSRIQNMGIPVFTLDMHRSILNPIGPYRLLRILQKEKPHILQTWLYHADLLGLLTGKLAHIPVTAWNIRCSNMDMQRYPKLTALVVRILARLSHFPDIVLVNSKSGKQFHESLGYHPHRWFISPNGFDLNIFHPNPEARIKLKKELGLSTETLIIGLIARFDPMKDHNNFIQAANILLKDNNEIHFVLAGYRVDQNNLKLTRTIADFHMESRIHLLGERTDITDITAALDIATSSSAYGEGFSNIIGEAMACGIPCAVTDVGDSALIVNDTGKIVAPKNPRALADAWSELIKMGLQGRNQLGLAARSRIETNFSLPDVITQYENLYKELSNSA